MKKTYMKPQMEVHELKVRQQILTGSGDVGTTGVGMSWDGLAEENEEGL